VVLALGIADGGAAVMAAPSCYGHRMKDKPLSPELDKIELYPDAWERTARAVKAAARHPPIHQQSKRTPKPSVVKKPRKR